MTFEQQLLDRITLDDRAALFEVARFLEQAARSWNRVEAGKRCELNALHHDDRSLASSLYWAIRAADELIEVIRTYLK